MFDFRKKLKDSLTRAIAETMDNLDSPIVFGHIFWGKLSEIGSVRITEIRINEDEGKSGLLHNLNTETAFTRHINRVGRNNTFADFLNLLFFKDVTVVGDKTNVFICQIRRGIEPLTYEVKGNEHHLKVSTEFADTLMPRDLLEEYVELFLRRETDDIHKREHVAEQLSYCKHKALEYLESRKDKESFLQLKKISEPSDATDKRLGFLGAFQTALLYRATCINEEEVGFISHMLCIHNSEVPKLALDNPVVLVSSIIKSIEKKDELIDSHQTATMKIRAAIMKVAYPNIQEITTETEILTVELPNIRFFGKFYKMIGDHIDRELKIKFQPTWAQNITIWNAFLIETLRNSVHEGRNLNFTFVIADVSEVKDSNLFEVAELSFVDNAKDIFHPWDPTAEGDKIKISCTDHTQFKSLLKSAKRNIEKKNYSWFSEGKYALLWDSAFPNKYPHSLLRIKDSSWDVVINDLRSNRPSRILSNVSLIITFVRADQSGGLFIKDRLVATFRRGTEWRYEISGDNSRDEGVKEALRKAFSKWSDEVSESETKKLEATIYRALLAVSEDPHMGCMLIIGKTIKDSFKSMGKPWQTKRARSDDHRELIDPNILTIDEITSLMAMDGATCLYLCNGQPSISFRNSVMTSKGDKSTDVASGDLEGEGSRKWSALIASSKEEVDLVVAVSQDGPIYIYETDENNTVKLYQL
jgi:hypothetical protein